MTRVNINILGISELTWMGMGEFNSDDHYIYYWGTAVMNGMAIWVTEIDSNPGSTSQLLGEHLKLNADIWTHI